MAEPVLPMGRRVELPGRGTTFIREMPGPPGAPVVVLLHGLLASAGLNWLHSFGPLGRRYRVVAVDLRGHARGLRSSRRFRLADCADDVAALLDVLGIESAVAWVLDGARSPSCCGTAIRTGLRSRALRHSNGSWPAAERVCS